MVYSALDTCFIVAMAPTKKRLDLGFFTPISKEEMERRSELEFAVLNNKLEKERSMIKHALPKRPVGRPKKDRTAAFLKPKVERMKPLVSKPRGNYKNRFTPSLCPPIFKAMQQARNITNALMYLRAAYRQPGSLHSPYDSLARSTMYEWFHPNGELKKNYKRCVELGTYFDKASQHCPTLCVYPALKDEICNVLR